MKIRKIVISYSNTKEYTENKLDLDIDKVNKSISVLEEYIYLFHYKLDAKKQELLEKKDLLNFQRKNINRLTKTFLTFKPEVQLKL